MKTLTRQEILDKVVAHAKKQNKVCHDGDAGQGCLYREDKTATCKVRCFAGVLIPDEAYDPNMEQATVPDDGIPVEEEYCTKSQQMLVVRGLILGGVALEDFSFVKQLQSIHDNSIHEKGNIYEKEWRKLLISIADEYGLQFNEPN